MFHSKPYVLRVETRCLQEGVRIPCIYTTSTAIGGILSEISPPYHNYSNITDTIPTLWEKSSIRVQVPVIPMITPTVGRLNLIIPRRKYTKTLLYVTIVLLKDYSPILFVRWMLKRNRSGHYQTCKYLGKLSPFWRNPRLQRNHFCWLWDSTNPIYR